MKFLAITLLLISFALNGQNFTLNYSTYHGGQQEELARDIAFDCNGNFVVVGGSASPSFTTTPGVIQEQFSTGNRPEDKDAIITKYDPQGNMIWSTFLGGPNYDRAYAVEIDSEGFIYVAGRCGDGFPVTNCAYQTTFGGDSLAQAQGASAHYGEQDAFISKITPDGQQLVWSSFFGENDMAIFRDITIDQSGAVYATIQHINKSVSYISANAYQTNHAGAEDMGIVKFLPDGTDIEWATYFGGSGNDGWGASIRINSLNQLVIAATTESNDLPVTQNAYDQTFNGNADFYLMKLSNDGTQLLYSTYFGGNDFEGTETHCVMVDQNDDMVISGVSKSNNCPTTSGTYATSHSGNCDNANPSTTGCWTDYSGDVFVARFDVNGSLQAATLVGGSLGDGGEGVTIDQQGNVVLSGGTFSNDFPTTPNALSTTKSGNADGIVCVLSSDLTSLIYSSYIGGSAIDYLHAIEVSPEGDIITVGSSDSGDYPILGNTIDGTNPSAGTQHSVVVTRLNTDAPINYTSCGTHSGNFTDPCTASLEKEVKETVQMYPNPSSGWVRVSNVRTSDYYIVKNINGQVIQEGTVDSKKKIHLPESDGIYFITIIKEGKVITKKVIKK